MNAFEQRLAEIESLPDNWGSCGELAPSKEALTRLRHFMRTVEPQEYPDVLPAPDGGLYAVWDKALGITFVVDMYFSPAPHGGESPDADVALTHE